MYSKEVWFYVINLVILYFWIIPSIGSKLKTKCTGYWRCNSYLTTTWPGYQVDLADNQWREIRSTFYILWICLFVVVIGHVAIVSSAKKNSRVRVNIFRLIVGLGFIIVLHGWHSLIVIGIALLGYYVSMSKGGLSENKNDPGSTDWFPLKIWAYALFVILFKESYRIQHHYPMLKVLFDKGQYGGMYSWQLPVNFLVLRIVSYGMDHHWAVQAAETVREEQRLKDHPKEDQDVVSGDCESPSHHRTAKGGASTSTITESQQDSSSSSSGTCPISMVSTYRWFCAKDYNPQSDGIESVQSQAEKNQNSHRHLDQYNLFNYLTYALYAPLYMAGPIMSFNSFVHYTHRPQQSEEAYKYGIRWICCLLLMEYMTNQYPFFAILQSGLFPYLSIGEIAIVSYIMLKMMWLKFLLIWRFFRLWALADGFRPLENMKRCMSNNCTLEQFWKGWHASFNSWIVRYMYIPLGGRHTRLWNVWLVFLFVAVWHDIEYKLLVWGLLNAFFYGLEVLGKQLLASDFVHKNLHSVIIKVTGILAAASYIFVLIGINLLGYAVGTGGIEVISKKLYTYDGLQVLAVCYYYLIIGVNVMSTLQTAGSSSTVKS